MFSWSSLQRPIIALAPMAGYTDSPYRQLVKEICSRVICFTEFTSVDGILHDNEATMRQILFHPEKERPIVAQIFGKKPENFRRAAKVLTELSVDAIDINMGCPAKKIISSDCGSSLLKNPELAEEIVRATVESTPLPVSVKMRIGTLSYDEMYFFDFARRMEQAGAKLLTVHGRTSKQMYGGEADWTPIYALKKILKIPVIGNGDIRGGADALNKIGKLDGLMVGRGSFGNPWVFQEILAAFENSPYTPPTFAEKISVMMHHLDLACAFKNEKWGTLEMRKQFAWYIRGIPHASDLRQKLVTASSRQEVISIYNEWGSNSLELLEDHRKCSSRK
jgi:tRNA-dihydrouridine synthase B